MWDWTTGPGSHGLGGPPVTSSSIRDVGTSKTETSKGKWGVQAGVGGVPYREFVVYQLSERHIGSSSKSDAFIPMNMLIQNQEEEL